MKRGLPSNLVIAAASADFVVAASLEDGTPLRDIKLLPMGEIKMRDGRGPFQLVDRAHAEAVVAATRMALGGVDFNFDYDHQTVFGAKPGVGGQAKASGWVKPQNIVADDDGIWAKDVQWTAAGLEALTAREYRYVSPVFLVDQAKRVSRLKNAALVNSPAIDLPAIAASFGECDDMNFTAIAAALGLAETADEATIVAAIGTLKTSASAIAVAAGLAETATVEEIAASVTDLKKAGTPDPKKFVSIELLQENTARLAVLEGERQERIVTAAISEGKLAPAQKDWGLKLIAASQESWDGWYATAPVVVAPGPQPGGKQIEAATTLSADEIAACEMTGVSHADFLKHKNALAGVEIA